MININYYILLIWYLEKLNNDKSDSKKIMWNKNDVTTNI